MNSAEKVRHQFMHWMLVDPAYGVIRFAGDGERAVIEAVASLHLRASNGEKVPREEWAVAASAVAAAAASAAAASAAASYAASYAYASAAAAASAAAYDAAKNRQREKMAELSAAASQ